MLAPTVVELANDFSGKVKVAKLDAAQEPNLTGKLDIEGFPTLILFEGGKEIDRIPGMPRGDVRQILSAWIREKVTVP